MSTRSILSIAGVLLFCAPSVAQVEFDAEAVAERYFRAVYGCQPEVVPELAADSVVISYPVFQEVLGVPNVRGSDAAVSFSERLCRRWEDPELHIDDHPLHSWGGITLVRLSEDGLVEAEIGEESTPGPTARVAR